MKPYLRTALMALSFTTAINTTAQVPVLNSFPSAQAVILLDFDGHVVNGTSWNYAGPITCNSSGLDNTKITTVFNQVAEDYRPFNINITTEEAKYAAAPANRRMRVILTTSYEWYGSAGGVAFVGSFIWGDDNPCFVFSSLLSYNTKYISEAASHEAGHTLGLYHQSTYNASCVKISDYNSGTGTGETGWAPIMGVGYYKNSTTWFNGPNSYGCANYQNDLAVILAGNGVSYRPDDYAETFAAAPAQSFTNDQFVVNAMISTATEKDMFKFTLATAKRVKINAVPKNVGAGNSGSNLDILMQLFNTATTSIGSYNPVLTLNVSVDTILGPGTYYILIDGIGNINTPGYDGSLGEYTITTELSPPTTLPLRKLQLNGTQNGDRHLLSWVIDADEQVIEQILESSTDGRNFSSVTQSDNVVRSYAYRPNTSSTVQYRMNVTFDNGRQYYSNIVTLRKTGATVKPKLISNHINANFFEVSSPGNYTYAVYDFNGKSLVQGKLINGSNTIAISDISSGMYVVRFANGAEQWIEKFIKQ